MPRRTGVRDDLSYLFKLNTASTLSTASSSNKAKRPKLQQDIVKSTTTAHKLSYRLIEDGPRSLAAEADDLRLLALRELRAAAAEPPATTTTTTAAEASSAKAAALHLPGPLRRVTAERRRRLCLRPEKVPGAPPLRRLQLLPGPLRLQEGPAAAAATASSGQRTVKVIRGNAETVGASRSGRRAGTRAASIEVQLQAEVI